MPNNFPNAAGSAGAPSRIAVNRARARKNSRSESKNINVSGADLIHALHKSLTVQFALVSMVGDILEAVSGPNEKPSGGFVFIEGSE
jgi:hypothetical protein